MSYKFESDNKVKESLAEGAILAEPHQRFLAHLIDISGGLLLLGARYFARGMGSSASSALLWFLIAALACIQVILLTESGQTIGKKVLHIRIVKAGTQTNGGFFTNVVLRLFLNAFLNVIPLYYFVDSLMILRNDHRCAHDFIAGTQVIKGNDVKQDEFGDLMLKKQ